jgi:DNA primase
MIAPETLAQVKDRTDIVALIGDSVRLVKRGRSWVGLCPFHKEKSPSFHVHPERGFYHCFGCGESGSAIDFSMKVNGLDFIEAVKMLAERAGVPIEETRADRRGPDKTEKEELFGVIALAATYFEKMLGLGEGKGARHPCSHYAERELERRGMPHRGATGEDALRWREVLAAFRIGYAPPGWDGLATFLRQQGVSLPLAERAGLVVKGQRGHYDRFRHRLMFAVVDTLGRVVAFSGRALAPPTREELAALGAGAPSYGGDDVAKYVNSPESPVFTKGEHLFGIHQAKQAIRRAAEAVLVEGNFDVVTLHARGIDRAIAPLGTAFTAPQARLIKRFAPSVVILFDGDAAGRKATRAARVPCREGGLEAKVAVLEKGMDPDELVRTRGPAALLEVLKGARGMLEYLVEDALSGDGFIGASIAERVARVRAVTKLLGEEDDPALRLMAKRYADQLSSKLVVAGSAAADLRQLERMVEEAVSHGPATREARPAPKEKTSPAQTMALAVLGALIDYPELLDHPDVRAALSAVDGDVALAIVAVRQSLWKGGSASDFLAAIPSSIQSFAAGRLASPVFEDLALARSELLDNSNKIRSLLWQRQNSDARDVLMKAPSSLDSDSELLLREIEQRARRKRGLDG